MNFCTILLVYLWSPSVEASKKILEEMLEIQIHAWSEAWGLGSWWLIGLEPKFKGQVNLRVMKERVRKKDGLKIWRPRIFAKNRGRTCKHSLKVGGRLMTWLYCCKELRQAFFKCLRIKLSNSTSNKAWPPLNPSSATTTAQKKTEKKRKITSIRKH